MICFSHTNIIPGCRKVVDIELAAFDKELLVEPLVERFEELAGMGDIPASSAVIADGDHRSGTRS